MAESKASNCCFIAAALVALWLILIAPTAEGSISCYTCSSRNGSDSNCQDPFHPAMSDYKIGCMVPKKGHIGKFPANFCVKVVGTVYTTSEKLVIRTCTLENMENQCGEFKFENESLAGCVLTCQTDGCNGANTLVASTSISSSFFLLYSAIMLVSHYALVTVLSN